MSVEQFDALMRVASGGRNLALLSFLTLLAYVAYDLGWRKR